MLAWLLIPGLAVAQHGPHANISVPLNQTGNSFYEQFGVNFGFHVGNFFYQQNGGAAPPFGGFNPGAGLNTGFNIHAPGGFDGHFNIMASQGAQTSLVSQTVSTTVPSGVPGFVSDTSQTPFVMGVVPVVGDGGISPVRERLERIKEGGAAAYGPRSGTATNAGGTGQRSAAQGATDAESSAATSVDGKTAAASTSTAEQPPAGSVAQLQQLRTAAAAVQQQETQAIITKAQEAEAAGKLGQAAHLLSPGSQPCRQSSQRATIGPCLATGRLRSLQAERTGEIEPNVEAGGHVALAGAAFSRRLAGRIVWIVAAFFGIFKLPDRAHN